MFILSYFLTFYPDINAHPNVLMIPMVLFVGIQALFCMIAALTVAIVVSAAARVRVGVCVRVGAGARVGVCVGLCVGAWVRV